MTAFDEVKEAINLKNFIEAETRTQMGRHHLKTCPFCGGHDCFSIKDQLFNCFQCDSGGDVFTFLQKFYNISKKEALEKAATAANITIDKRPRRLRMSAVEKILFETAQHYHSNINAQLDYLTKTRGHKQETISHFQVGLSTGDLVMHLRNKGFSDADIIASGIAKERVIKDQKVMVDLFSKGLLIYPHFINGKVCHFTTKDPDKKKPPFQLPAINRSKKWFFYNQDAIEQHREIILVEGEDDLQSVYEAGIPNIIGMIGQISQEQLKALSSKLRGKILYLWMDNDQAGHKYIRKICQLNELEIKIILYRDDCDPDKYLKEFKGDTRKEINSLIQSSVDYITWEIIQTGLLYSLEDKLDALKEYKIFNAIAVMPEIKRQIYAEKLVGIGFSKNSIAEQLEEMLDIRRKLNIYYETLSDKGKADPNVVASIIFSGFNTGGMFFYDNDASVFLLYNNFIYEISNNRPFNALMKKHTMLLPTRDPGRSVWESLASEGYNSGNQINFSSWTHTDRIKDTIFLNLNSKNNIILKVNKKGVEEIPNGLNEHEILLRPSDNIKPFTYLPDAGIRQGFKLIKELILDTLACEKEQRWLIVSWMISSFLLDFVSAQALMKFSGSSSAGKSKCAGRISYLLYGEDLVGDTSAAAAFSEASRNPLVFIDNLESMDIHKSILKFLLLAATGGPKAKRTVGTETNVTKEKPKALILITAIEPFLKPELINRTIEIEFSQQYWIEGFSESDTIGDILKNRDIMLSAILKLIAKDILPNLKERKQYLTILQKEYRTHSKRRMNEYIALLMLILDKMLPYLPYYDEDDVQAGLNTGSAEIRKAWLMYQNTLARDTEIASNTILKMLDGIVREYILRMKERDIKVDNYYGYDEPMFRYQDPDYGLTLFKSKPRSVFEDGDEYMESFIEFEATSKDLVYAFDKFCKNNGQKNPYSTAAVFGVRLKNDMELLNKGGWILVKSKDNKPYFKTIKGARFYKFRHVLIR